jgi:hypothetical protein
VSKTKRDCYEWRKLRADELRDQAHRDAIVILLVASLDRHGPHLPVEVDSILGGDGHRTDGRKVTIASKGCALRKPTRCPPTGIDHLYASTEEAKQMLRDALRDPPGRETVIRSLHQRRMSGPLSRLVNYPGWIGQHTREEAEGALENGTRVRKIGSRPRERHQDGAPYSPASDLKRQLLLRVVTRPHCRRRT